MREAQTIDKRQKPVTLVRRFTRIPYDPRLPVNSLLASNEDMGADYRIKRLKQHIPQQSVASFGLALLPSLHCRCRKAMDQPCPTYLSLTFLIIQSQVFSAKKKAAFIAVSTRTTLVRLATFVLVVTNNELSR